MRRQLVIVLIGAWLGGWCGSTFAASAVEGYFTAEGLTGKTAPLHGWEDRWLWIGQVSASPGAGGRAMAVTPKGWYRLPQYRPPYTFDPGTYALFALSYDGPHGFGYRSLTIPSGVDVLQNQTLTTDAHYSVMYNESWYEWTAEPWVWGTDFYQTFVATQQHITRVCTKLAGKEGDHQSMTLNFAVYQTNAGPPSTWTQILPTRSYWLPGTMDPIIHILWVPYRSNEVTLTPGQTYAARFWRAPGSASQNFAIVARPDSSGNGYSSGIMYSGDTPYPGWDAYAHITGGKPGTLVNHTPVDIQAGDYGTWATRHGQTFQATGTSVAAVDVHYITGEGTPPIKTVTFQVYDAVGGNPIGPARTTYGWPEFWRAMVAAYWQENEVPTTPGQMYYMEWTISDTGANVYFMRLTDNVPGNAYINRVAQGSHDMLMSIAEYLPSSPIIELSVSELNVVAQQGKNAPTDTFTVGNGGGGTLNYTITDNRTWLSVSPPSGSCTTEDDPIDVIYTTSSLAKGTYSGTITVAGNATNSPQTIDVSLKVYIPGDFDEDADVDMEDFGHFQACLTGPGINVTDPDCLDANLDSDTDVDGDDFNIINACLSGADIPPAPACAP